MQGAIVPLLIALAWEWGSRSGRLPPDTFSRPSAILMAFVHGIADGSILAATLETLSTAAFAWLLAGLAGIALGVAVGTMPLFARVTGLTIEALRPIPSVALIPLALVLFGFGFRLEAWVTGFAVVWPVVLLTASGVRSIDGRVLEVGRALGFGRTDRLIKFVLPAALPSIAVGLRVAAGFALVVAVTVEIALNPRGIGFGMITAQQQFHADIMYAELLWLGVVGFGINALMLGVERRAIAWSTLTAAAR
jgi:ABC-type nitrate/sulfonate/bicarbonate transport system permease component